MKKLLSLPPNLVNCFHQIAEVSEFEYFCTSDPIGSKLGSGGGTNWLLTDAYLHDVDNLDGETPKVTFQEWLSREKRILLHAGGQSRRLPGYAPSGKILTPIPVFRWERGQRIDQNLLQLQLPLYNRIMEEAPSDLHTMIVSGDVFIRAGKLQQIPNADVVCYGLWVDPLLAQNHGVFLSKRETPEVLDFVLQKPSVQKLGTLMHSHLFLMDVGMWLLSDRAVDLLIRRSSMDSVSDSSNRNFNSSGIKNYDLYSDFGQALGQNPTIYDEEVSQLTVAVLPLQDGEFYHYGTSREMISSTVAIQNLIYDQRSIMHLGVKPHPSIFIQNSHTEISLTSENQNVWIENSHVNSGWTLTHNNIITGVPRNNWSMTLSPDICVDVVPIGETDYVLRPYGFNDAMRGDLHDDSTLFMGVPVTEWLQKHYLCADDIQGNNDLQNAQIFPVSDDIEVLGQYLLWMLGISDNDCSEYISSGQIKGYLSANQISDSANLLRLHRQRLEYRRDNLNLLARNHRNSVFYQSNLDNMAQQFHRLDVPMPEPLPENESLIKRINDQMFRSRLTTLNGGDGEPYSDEAFRLLRDGLTEMIYSDLQSPHLDVYSDQIVWGRSPVRIDLAGGWTDTPPYCLSSGGSVVNLAIELNGQQPLQAYVKPCRDFKIILRSIDLGAIEEVSTWDELSDYHRVGSPFSIPKAALSLAGFLPKFSLTKYSSLVDQLHEFGSGIEVTLLSAIPAGSGLGTSSILASTVLGAISDFCGLNWDKTEICNRTLILEQLLTTGGGWQDQYGGVIGGIKLLRTKPGFVQTPEIRWLNDNIYNDPLYSQCHLLYYTGITRTAKKILAEIVRGMFLYNTEMLQMLDNMKEHSMDMYQSIMRNDFQQFGSLVGKTWKQNQILDSGTNPPEVQAIIDMVKDYCLGLKLPGAGGGGFLYMVARDPEAACRIREILTSNPPNKRARFVDMSLSKSGLQVSRS